MAHRHDRYAGIARVATPHDGIVTTPELHALGFSDGEVHNLVQAGLLHRIRKGLFAVGHEALCDRARWSAMLQAAGPDSALDFLTAAHHWGIAKRRSPIVHITTKTQKRPVAGARFHRRPGLEPSDFARHLGLRTVTVTRTIASLARIMRAGELAGVMREAGHLGRLDVDSLEELVDREHGQHGIPTLREALKLRAGGGRGSRASTEQRVFDYIKQFPVEVPAWNSDLSAFGETWEVDFVFRKSRIYLEVDGITHDAENVRIEDEKQDTLLSAVGWRPFRIDPREFDRDRVEACGDVLRALLDARPSPSL